MSRSVRAVLEAYGHTDLDAAAAEWERCGFDGPTVDDWLAARVTDAYVAALLASGGITPADVPSGVEDEFTYARAAEVLRGRHGHTRFVAAMAKEG